MTGQIGHTGPMARLTAWIRAVLERLRDVLLRGQREADPHGEGPPSHWLADIEARGLDDALAWSGHGAEAGEPPLAAPGRVPPSPDRTPGPLGRAQVSHPVRTGRVLPDAPDPGHLPRPVPVHPAGPFHGVAPDGDASPRGAGSTRMRPQRGPVRIHTRVEVLSASQARALEVAPVSRDPGGSGSVSSPHAAPAPALIPAAGDRDQPEPARPLAPPAPNAAQAGPFAPLGRPSEAPLTPSPEAGIPADPSPVAPGARPEVVPMDTPSVRPRPGATVHRAEPEHREPAPRAGLRSPSRSPGPDETVQMTHSGPPGAMAPPDFPSLPATGPRAAGRPDSAADRFFREGDAALRRAVWGSAR